MLPGLHLVLILVIMLAKTATMQRSAMPLDLARTELRYPCTNISLCVLVQVFIVTLRNETFTTYNCFKVQTEWFSPSSLSKEVGRPSKAEGEWGEYQTSTTTCKKRMSFMGLDALRLRVARSQYVILQYGGPRVARSQYNEGPCTVLSPAILRQRRLGISSCSTGPRA